MHGIKIKKLSEADEYEPLSQQVYADLVKEIDRLFDALKNDLSAGVFDLKWDEWQKMLLKHSGTLNESYAPVPLRLIVESKKLVKQLRYDLRENANAAIKANKIIELYRDRLKKLVKDSIFRAKTMSPEEAYKKHQTWRDHPEFQQIFSNFTADTDHELARSVLANERDKFDKERKAFELERQQQGKTSSKQQRGTQSATKATPGSTPGVPPQPVTQTTDPNTATPSKVNVPPQPTPKPTDPNTATPPNVNVPPQPATKPTDPNTATSPNANTPLNTATEPAKSASPMATANPNPMDPARRLQIIKLGLVVNRAMKHNGGKQVNPADVEKHLNMLTTTGKIDDIDVDIIKDNPEHEEKMLKIGMAYLALHGGGDIGELETGKKPVVDAEKSVAELVTMTNVKLIEYLTKTAGEDAIEDAKKEFKGIPKTLSARQSFIEKVLASKKKEESVSLGKKLRIHLRNKVRLKPILEGIDDKVDYLKKLLRSR